MAENYCVDDRRRVVNAGVRHGRDAEIEDLQAAADVGFTITMSGVVAIRGARLALVQVRASGRDAEASQDVALNVVEVDGDERIAAAVVFDLDDFDSAIAELDARYLAGEAAAHSQTWKIVADSYAALNRREIPPLTRDCVNIDHRRETAFGPEDLTAYMHAGLDLDPNINVFVEQVLRLNKYGAVLTYAAHESSQEGFDAEWRGIAVLTVDGAMVNRIEVFDEPDVETAIARFGELGSQTRRLENAASQVGEGFLTHFAAADWVAMAEMLAEGFSNEDRRRMVGGGVRHGRSAQIEDMRAIADLFSTKVTPTTIATRGAHLALMRLRFSASDHGPEAFLLEADGVVEINGDKRIVAVVFFDVDDTDAAFAELDARYLAGDAAPYARAWRLGLDTIAELNRHERGPLTEQLAYADHRRVPFASGEEFGRGVEELWELVPDARYRVKTAHALAAHGNVVTLVIEGTDAHGNQLQWGRIIVFACDEPRVEVYEEDDVDAALARFEELRPHRLENAATRRWVHVADAFNRRDLARLLTLTSGDGRYEQRRKGLRDLLEGPARQQAARALLETAPDTWQLEVETIAIRGSRLSLTRERFRDIDEADRPVAIELLRVTEVSNRAHDTVSFDPDDIDAAFDELDARYLVGEAAAHAHTWSVIAGAYATFNRHELPAPTTRAPVYIDHRPLLSVEGADLAASLRAMLDLTSDVCVYIEAVHRLTELGAVVTQVVKGTWQGGSDAELRMIAMFTVDGDFLTRCEIFDETDLDAAISRFGQPQPEPRRLKNAAGHAAERFLVHFAARDWDSMAEILAADISVDDRRRGINAGTRYGRDAAIEDLRASVDAGFTTATSMLIAARGRHLGLVRVHFSERVERPEAFLVDVLHVVETNAEGQTAAVVIFDVDDAEAAFNELDARYLAGEAAAHAHTWALVTRAYEALNRRQLPETTADWVNVDHRRLAPIATGDLREYLVATWDLSPQSGIRIEAVHRLSDLGAVVTQVVEGTSHQGFDAEWRTIDLSTYEGDKINRCELFDEQDLDAALARFDELDRPAPTPENAATRIWSRLADAFDRRDLDGFLALTTADLRYEDRRKGLRDEFEGPARRKNMQAMFDAAPSGSRLTVEAIATRGQRFSLTRAHYGDPDDADAPIVEMLQITEVSRDGLMHGCVSFDPDDIDAAFADLDARYLGGEAASHSHAWSLIVQAYAAANRYELPPTTPDWVNIDHRRGRAFAPGDMEAYLHATWDLAEDVKLYIEAVHRLSDLGAVVTHTAYGTSREGFDAEWREVNLLTAEGDMINRCEVFDEADIDAALARFDELERPRSHETT
ncbi:hypothetical protein MTAB308_5368 [Mycobacterium terramassiliense]|uniref:Uncharacterized protein n=1 Tax=Mycobacterium terramassiliense TaxID=1841859 RepID=A0A2U3NKA4_9MYCO|nr:hypothetical protein MTAB308_5368 [Mycobacterium terramassiliense]